MQQTVPRWWQTPAAVFWVVAAPVGAFNLALLPLAAIVPHWLLIGVLIVLNAPGLTACWGGLTMLNNFGPFQTGTGGMPGIVMGMACISSLISAATYGGLASLACYLLTWRSRRSIRRVANGQCSQCGYDLRGSDGETCPECGAIEKRLTFRPPLRD